MSFAEMTPEDQDVWRQIVSRPMTWQQFEFVSRLLIGMEERDARDLALMHECWLMGTRFAVVGLRVVQRNMSRRD